MDINFFIPKRSTKTTGRVDIETARRRYPRSREHNTSGDLPTQYKTEVSYWKPRLRNKVLLKSHSCSKLKQSNLFHCILEAHPNKVHSYLKQTKSCQGNRMH